MIGEDFAAVTEADVRRASTPTISRRPHPDLSAAQSAHTCTCATETYQWEEDLLRRFRRARSSTSPTIGHDDALPMLFIWGSCGTATPARVTVENYWEDDGHRISSREPVKCTDLGPSGLRRHRLRVRRRRRRRPHDRVTSACSSSATPSTDPGGDRSPAPRRRGHLRQLLRENQAVVRRRRATRPTTSSATRLPLSRRSTTATPPSPRDYRRDDGGRARSGAPARAARSCLPDRLRHRRRARTACSRTAPAAQLTFDGRSGFNLTTVTTVPSGVAGRETARRRVRRGASTSTRARSTDSLRFRSRPTSTRPSTSATTAVTKRNFQRRLRARFSRRQRQVPHRHQRPGDTDLLDRRHRTATAEHAHRSRPTRDGVADLLGRNFSGTCHAGREDADSSTSKAIACSSADNWARPAGYADPPNGPVAPTLWKTPLPGRHRTQQFVVRTPASTSIASEPLTHVLTPPVKAGHGSSSIEQFLDGVPGPRARPARRALHGSLRYADARRARRGSDRPRADGRIDRYRRSRSIHRGRPYFYAVTAGDHGVDDATGAFRRSGKVGDPSSNFAYV